MRKIHLGAAVAGPYNKCHVPRRNSGLFQSGVVNFLCRALGVGGAWPYDLSDGLPVIKNHRLGCRGSNVNAC